MQRRALRGQSSDIPQQHIANFFKVEKEARYQPESKWKVGWYLARLIRP
jgi:hypothetical protein